MINPDIEALRAALKARWGSALAHSYSNDKKDKVGRYIGKFFDCTRLESRISGKVVGNHGTYTVTIQVKGDVLTSACSCYIGKGGYCHHCLALAITFLNDTRAFEVVKTRTRDEIKALATLKEYLDGVTLDALLQELKAKGLTQKAFAESMGMNPRHLTAVRSSELRNHFYNELGAIKLACLWVMEHFESGTFKKTPSRGRAKNAKTKQD
jgi:uncharacterized Zn finger protein